MIKYEIMLNKLIKIIMNHVAILDTKQKMLEKIIAGRKTIESRWYKNRVAPWNRINKGDIIYFKKSSKLVDVKAEVDKVIQYSCLDKIKIKEIIDEFYYQIGLDKKEINYNNYDNKNYCILVFIKNVKEIEPFNINKKGFGNASAWICIDDINKIKEKHGR